MFNDADRHLDQARTALDTGDPQGAARTLRFAAVVPELHRDDDRLNRLLGLAAAVAEAMGIEAMRQACSAARALRPGALYDAAYELVEVGLSELAVPVLRRVDLEDPGQASVVSELAVALERIGRSDQARDLLLAHPALLDDFWLRYLLCFNAVVAGDLDTARTQLVELQVEPDIEGSDIVVGRIHAMLRRSERLAGTCSLDFRDLRGWHYVINGSLLLELSPWGFDQGMAGRYAFLQDSPASMRDSLCALLTALAAWSRPLAQVVELPERGSRITARALGRLAGLPVVPWKPGVRGQVVAYDIAQLPGELLVELRDRGDTLLYARAACWTQPPPIVPELIGLLHQSLIPPWGELIRSDAETGQTSRQLASTEPDDVWAERIELAVAPGDPPERVEPPEMLERVAAVAVPDRGDRFWEASPVKSARFG